MGDSGLANSSEFPHSALANSSQSGPRPGSKAKPQSKPSGFQYGDFLTRISLSDQHAKLSVESLAKGNISFCAYGFQPYFGSVLHNLGLGAEVRSYFNAERPGEGGFLFGGFDTRVLTKAGVGMRFVDHDGPNHIGFEATAFVAHRLDLVPDLEISVFMGCK